MPRVRIFIACSLDGYISGAGDDLSWLPEPSEELGDEHGFDGFLSQMGALLMGRNTFNVADAYEGDWPYGDLPVLVATNRPLSTRQSTVRPVIGPINELIEDARDCCKEGDIYLDGGNLIRQALDENLIDEMTITIVPIILGKGSPLFSGVKMRQSLKLRHSKTLQDGMVQLTYRTVPEQER